MKNTATSSMALHPLYGKLPLRFRMVDTISPTLYGAVIVCESVDPSALQPTTVAAKTALALNLDELAQQQQPRQRRAFLAAKIMSLPLAESASAIASRPIDDPWQEYRVASTLIASGGHRNVLQFYQQFVLDDVMFLMTEFCTGGDLYEYMTNTPTRTIPEIEARFLFRQIVLGVNFLHKKLRIAHRDLSLENVLLRDGICKISDFGLSMSASARSCDCVGKEYYMAPEVVAEEQYDPCAADVWSLGIMLFIMLTGSPLLPVASRLEVGFATIASYGVVPVLEAWGVANELSVAVMDLLSQMLQVEPAKRISVAGILSHAAMQA